MQNVSVCIVGLVTLLIALFATPQHAYSQAGAWSTTRSTDAMSGDVTTASSHMYSLEHGLHINATASCGMGIVNFSFEAFGPNGSGINLAWEESETYSGTTFGFSTQLSRDVHRWVPLRVRVGHAPVLQRNSSSKFRNQAEIVFYDPERLQAAADAQQAKLKSGSGYQPPPASLGEGLNMFSDMMNSLTAVMLPSLLPVVGVGTFSDLLAAGEFRVELPLADGRTPVIIVSPAASGLQSFLANCGVGTPAAAFDGVFNGAGMKMMFHNGSLVMQRGNKQAPPLAYRRSGNQVFVTDPDHITHEFDITAEGDLVMRNGSETLRLTRER